MTPELHTGFLVPQDPLIFSSLSQLPLSSWCCISTSSSSLPSSSPSVHITAPSSPLLLPAPDNPLLQRVLDLGISVTIQQGLQKCCKWDLKACIKMSSLLLSIPRGTLGESGIIKCSPLAGSERFRQQSSSAVRYQGKSVQRSRSITR